MIKKSIMPENFESSLIHHMQEYIKVVGAREHNLKNISVDIPREKLVVITGPSGSGKSSLAFDTIYAEGQRRYVESLSAYARQFLHLHNKPDVDYITGLSPAIAIDQKTTSKNPRSTVGTITEIYDHFRLLFARVGIPYSPATGLPILSQTISEMVDQTLSLGDGTKIYILAPIARGEKGEFRKEFIGLKKQGFERVLIDGELHELDEIPSLEKNKKHNIEVLVDRIVISEDLGNRLAESIESALKMGDGVIYVEVVEYSEENINPKYKVGEKIIFSEKYSCPISGFQLTEIEPRIFSFNSPFGACPVCEGLGKESYFDPVLIVPDDSMSIGEGAIVPWKKYSSRNFIDTIRSLLRHYGADMYTPFRDISDKAKNVLFYGSGEVEIDFVYGDDSSKETIRQTFGGIIKSMDEKLKNSDGTWLKEEWSKFQSQQRCERCNGFRLKPESLSVKIAGLHIGEVADKSVYECAKWFETLTEHLNPRQNKIAERILKEIRARLNFLLGVGLEYLTLSRESGSLSGGESQRIRLASQIGSGLTGVVYVLDEPSIGLHQRDNDRLIETLKNLRDLGNSVIVVEHDEETVLAADHVIDIGEGAGVYGGKIISQGTPQYILNDKKSLTGQYLSRVKYIPIPETVREGNGKFIELKGARTNNLKGIDLKISLGTFTAITGVSGSGKSSLINHTLYKAAMKKLDNGYKESPGAFDEILGIEHIDKIIDIDQSPIGRTPRSNPATYTGAFTPIRDWFTNLPESKARGYKVGRFSFNVKGGRCEACEGDGLIKIEMHFLPDVYVNCDVCNGKRYNRETLDVKYKNKSIAEVLDMTVDEALEFFEKMPTILDKMQAMHDVGLGYIKIGQSATTLSGGEAQRIKLAKELSRRATGRTLYILDEPTTGLHTDDIAKLLTVLHRLVDAGNTVVVIEHNLDVIKTADNVVDIGPEGGDKGGNLVCSGTIAKIMECKESYTGFYLKKLKDR